MSRESEHTHFEDKIQEQVRLWGFPPTCASLPGGKIGKQCNALQCNYMITYLASSGGQICNWYKWRRLLARFATNASSPSQWSSLHLIQDSKLANNEIAPVTEWIDRVFCASGNIFLFLAGFYIYVWGMGNVGFEESDTNQTPLLNDTGPASITSLIILFCNNHYSLFITNPVVSYLVMLQ